MKTASWIRGLLVCCAVMSVGCRGDSDADGTGTDTEGDDDGDSAEGGDDDGGEDGVDATCVDRLPAQRVRRLSHAEYAATLSSLFGADAPELALAADNVVEGYDNHAEALTVSALLAEQYRQASETVAERLLADLDSLLPCEPVSDGEAACAEQFVRSFGRRVFRRPLADAEVERYTSLYADIQAEDGFSESLRWVIVGMLQSPNFLYRTELGVAEGDGTVVLTSHEIAAAISYLVVGTMPDEALAAAADDDTLGDVQQRLEHAERLLATEAAVTSQLRFTNAWLEVGLLEQVPRDAELFPEFTPEIRDAMRGELDRVVSSVFSSGGTFSELLTLQESYWTDELAAFYGAEAGVEAADDEGFRRVELSGDPGLLVRGALMATHALPRTPSPIHRGVMVRERILCNQLPPPPPGVANGIPEIDPDSSNRERYAIHSQDPACGGCHQLIDPIGFGFEHYDAVGRWQDMDGVHEIDATGTVNGLDDSAFDGAAEMAAVLAQSSEVTACYAEQWSRYVLGGLDQDDGLACLARQVATGFVEADGRLDSVVMALIASPGFVERSEGDAMPPSPDPGGDDGDGGDTIADDDSGDGETGELPPGDSEVDVEVVPSSSWPTGSCNDVTVTNVSDANVTWEVELPIAGMITTAWSSTYTEQDGSAVFVGEAFNATLEPGWSATFGYCSETG